MILYVDDSIYSNKESLCDVVDCQNLGPYDLKAVMSDKLECGEIKDSVFVCKEHSKIIDDGAEINRVVL